jgi:hypothetical protein
METESLLDRLENIPIEILNDPRRLVRDCEDCEHCREEGLCGLNLHPKDEWSKPKGCPEYDPTAMESGGDPSPDASLEYFG